MAVLREGLGLQRNGALLILMYKDTDILVLVLQALNKDFC